MKLKDFLLKGADIARDKAAKDPERASYYHGKAKAYKHAALLVENNEEKRQEN